MFWIIYAVFVFVILVVGFSFSDLIGTGDGSFLASMTSDPSGTLVLSAEAFVIAIILSLVGLAAISFLSMLARKAVKDDTGSKVQQ